MSPAPEIDKDLFERVARQLGRWSDRSIAVARSLLLDGLSLSEAALKHDMSSQQANVIRTRFIEKAEKVPLASFMEREKPKRPNLDLDSFKSEIHTLNDNGYTADQIVSFLAENNVVATATAIKTFLNRTKT